MTEITLKYAGMPQRVLVSTDGAWFAAKDIFAAHGLATDRAHLAYFATEHLRLVPFSSSEGPVTLTAVSPLGIATIASGLPFPKSRMLDAWVRKKSRVLAEEHGSAPLEMTLLADGRLPVKPQTYATFADDWYRLAIRFPHGDPRRADPDQSALFDEDPDLPPHAGAAAN